MLAKFLDARSDAHLIINFTWPKYKYINPALSYCWQMGWGGVWAGGRGKSLHALTPFMKKDANNWPNVVVTSSWRHFRHDVTQDPRKSRKSKFCSRILRNYIYKLPNPSFFSFLKVLPGKKHLWMPSGQYHRQIWQKDTAHFWSWTRNGLVLPNYWSPWCETAKSCVQLNFEH